MLCRRRLGFYRQEEAAARAYDLVAAWRNRDIAAERRSRAAEPRRRRRSAALGHRRRRDGLAVGGEGGEGEEEDGAGPARRVMSQQLPLNLPGQLEEAGLGFSLESLLEDIRGEKRRPLRWCPAALAPFHKLQASCACLIGVKSVTDCTLCTQLPMHPPLSAPPPRSQGQSDAERRRRGGAAPQPCLPPQPCRRAPRSRLPAGQRRRPPCCGPAASDERPFGGRRLHARRGGRGGGDSGGQVFPVGQQSVAFASLLLQRLCFACSAAANLKTCGFEQHVFAC